MYLDAVSRTTETSAESNGFCSRTDVFDKWREWRPSRISHHGSMCCKIARAWIAAADFSELGGGSPLTGPRWLRQKFRWGASVFPLFWCEAVRKTTLDCGALAALAHEIFTLRDVKSFRAQMIQKFSENTTSQWTRSWSASGNSALKWINNDLIYHEGCAIALTGAEIKIWDSSAGWWIDAKSAGEGYGSLLAIRVAANDSNAVFDWGNHRIKANSWQKVN